MGPARLLARTRRRGLPLRGGRPPPDARDRGPLPRAAARSAATPRSSPARSRPPTRCRSSTPASRCASGSTSSRTRWATSRSRPDPPAGPGRATAPRCSSSTTVSFDGFWRLDADGLTNAIDATPSSRFRVVEGDAGLLAYAVTGRAGHHGYLQRLAVASRRAPRGIRARRSCSTGSAGSAATARPRPSSTPSATTRRRSRCTSRAGSASCPPGCASWADRCEARRRVVVRASSPRVVAILVTLGAAPAHAAPGATLAARAPTPRVQVTLLEQPAWTDARRRRPVPARDHRTARRARGARDRALVADEPHRVRAHASTATGSARRSRPPARRPRRCPSPPNGGRILTLKLQDPNAPRDTSRLRLPLPRSSNTGVYPVEIELRDPESGERVAELRHPPRRGDARRPTARRWASR